MPVAICLPKKPKSINSKPNEKYREAIFSADFQQSGGALLSVPLYSRIIWFHKYPSTQGDIDNIAKAIHDALKGAVFADDRLITHTTAIRVDATLGYDIESTSSDPDGAYELLQHLDSPANEDVL